MRASHRTCTKQTGEADPSEAWETPLLTEQRCDEQSVGSRLHFLLNLELHLLESDEPIVKLAGACDQRISSAKAASKAPTQMISLK